MKDVQNYIRQCKECQGRNVSPHERVRAPQQVLIPHIFERFSLDFQGPFTPSAEGHTHVLNCMCLSTGYVKGIYLKPHEVDAKRVARFLVEEIILVYGPPRSILSDRGSQFMAALVRETMKLFGVQTVQASAYHPQTDGKVERVHRTLNNIIAKLIDDKHKEWELPYRFALHAYNTTANSVYGDTPYYLVHGRDCKNFADVSLLPNEPAPSVESWNSVQGGISDPKVRKWFAAWREQLTRNTEHSRRRARGIMQDQQMLMQRNHKYAEKVPREYMVGELVSVRDNSKPPPDRTKKHLPKYLPIPHRIVREVDTDGAEGGLAFVLRPSNDDSAPTITRNVDDIKPYYYFNPNEDTRQWAIVRKRGGNVSLPKANDTSDLPITGDSHGWDKIDGDEIEITRILGHNVEAPKGSPPVVRFQVRALKKHGSEDIWVRKEHLRAARLLAEYEAEHPDINDPSSWSGRMMRSKARQVAAGLIISPVRTYLPGIRPGYGANLSSSQRRARRRERLARLATHKRPATE